MNGSEFGDSLAGRLGLTKAVANDAAIGVIEAIGETAGHGEELQLAGSDAFAATSQPARTGRTPPTDEVLFMPASKTPSLDAGRSLRDGVKDGPGR